MDEPLELEPLLLDELELRPEEDDLELLLLDRTADLDELPLDLFTLELLLLLDLLMFVLLLPARFRVEVPPAGFPRKMIEPRFVGFSNPDLLVVPVVVPLDCWVAVPDE